MLLDQSLPYWLTLSQLAGLGNDGLRRLLVAFGSPNNIFLANLDELNRVVKPSISSAIKIGINEEIVGVTELWLQDPSNFIVTIADENYPKSLLNIVDPPFLLYVKGNPGLLNRPSLAVVGSRNATPQGLRNAESFAFASSEAGLCIVSGMALGIDKAAHIGGLRGKSSSIAVVGTGLDKVYPSSNRELAHELNRHGALVSEFPLGTPPLRTNFPRRNRIISGLSLGCLVVEASLNSGSLITARLALEQGRDVFAIPGSIHAPQSKGSHGLIKQGAKLVDDVQDILEELGCTFNSDTLKLEPQIEHPIFKFLNFEPIDLNSLSLLSGLTMSSLSAILLQLELDGHVSVLPGGLYQRVV